MAIYFRRLLIAFIILSSAATSYIQTNGVPQQGTTPTTQQYTQPPATRPQQSSSMKGDPTKGIHVQYGSLSCQELYYYLPYNYSGINKIVFMVHGGAWASGDCAQFKDNAIAAAKSGYIAVSMDYRKIQNGANAFDMVKDVANAITAFKKQLDSKGIRYGKMALAGWSAGAHLSLMYAYEYYYNACPIPIAFIIVCAPPTDFLADARSGRTLMGQMAYSLMTSLSGEVILPGTEASHMNAIKKISPIYMVKKGVPPTIVVNGEDDDVVPPSNSADLYEELQKKGIDSARVIYHNGAGHFLGSQYAEDKTRTQVFNQFAKKYF